MGLSTQENSYFNSSVDQTLVKLVLSFNCGQFEHREFFLMYDTLLPEVHFHTYRETLLNLELEHTNQLFHSLKTRR